MAKFKVGDKVRVRSDLNGKNRYYNEDKETWDNCVSEMFDLRGKTVTIKEVGKTGKYRICEESYWWTDEMFVEPRREFIVIRRDGAKTIAELRHDREVIKSGTAICNASDTFDFQTGAKLAFDRLMGREEPKPESKKLFKVGDRVVTSIGRGKIVQVDPDIKEGKPYWIKYDNGACYWKNSAEAKLEPNPAHRFKVGDRVKTEFGTGEIVFICDKDLDIPYLVYNENWDGCSGYLAEGLDVHKYRGRCKWFCERSLSPAPAPEPPKYYTGKVVCIESENSDRVGIIASMNDGVCSRDGWNRFSGVPYKSLEDFNSAWCDSKFAEAKE